MSLGSEIVMPRFWVQFPEGEAQFFGYQRIIGGLQKEFWNVAVCFSIEGKAFYDNPVAMDKASLVKGYGQEKAPQKRFIASRWKDLSGIDVFAI